MNISTYELTEADPVAEHPSNVNIRLKRHQLTMLQRCLMFENSTIEIENGYIRTHIGIIGDPVGSGKSYVVLSLIASPPMENNELSTRTYGDNKVVVMTRETDLPLKTNVLVIPHNICSQWLDYIQKFTSNFKYFTISRSKHFDLFKKEKVEELDLIVVTGPYYNRLAWYLNDKKLKMNRVIYDEVDSINITSCMVISSRFYWFVTASYANLLYPRGYSIYDDTTRRWIESATGLRNSGFVKDLFTDLSHYDSKIIARKLVIKNSNEFVRRSLQLPEIESRIIRCRTPMELSILQGVVDKNIIDCLNANDVESAVQLISPSNKTSEDSIISLMIDRFTKQLKNIEIRIRYTYDMEFESEEDKRNELEKLEKSRKEVTDKMTCIQDRIRDSDTCPICFDDFTKKTIVQCCSNAYCFKCINIWLGNKQYCPMCKCKIKQQDLFVVTENADASTSAFTDSNPSCDHTFEIHESNSKERNIENLIDKRFAEDSSCKFLIFSSFEYPMRQVACILQRKNIKFAHLKGNMACINSTIDKYKNGDVSVLLINARYYGSGLNLENTSDIIMYHKFDSEIEKQVIGRAQRLGRNDSLKVWYLLHDTEGHF